MKISYNWLKWYIDGELPSPEKLEEIFTFKLCEVEGIEKLPDGDAILDLNILPNRAHDLLSHQGVARELAGILKLPFKDPTPLYKVPESHPTSLTINAECSRRYKGRIIRNIKIGPSPEWVVKHLESIGQRSINNIVDATNLVMYDCGQPCHAFDYDKVKGAISVREAKEGEQITTLDNKQVSLIQKDFVVADEEGVLALAGVKGGKKAEVDANTTNIILEVGNFFPARVRWTARRLGLLTDSAKRFENDLSPELCGLGMAELTGLIVEMCPDAVFEDVVEEYSFDTFKREHLLEFSVSWINAQLGTSLSSDEMVKILTDYGYEISGAGDTRTLSVPYLRLDLTGQHDIAEEVLRLYGLENIQAVPLSLKGKSEMNPIMYKILAARQKLVADGYRETMTYSFRKKGVFEVARGVGDKSALRTDLGDGLREAFEMNKLNASLLGIDTLKLFEIGNVFPQNGEITHIATANKSGVVEMTLDEWCDKNGITVGESYDEVLPAESASETPFKQWSLYPFIVRDVALWVPQGIQEDDILKIMDGSLPKLVVGQPRLFDTFQKDGRTSYAFRLIFQSPDKTLTDGEVDAEFGPFVETLKSQGWEIR